MPVDRTHGLSAEILSLGLKTRRIGRRIVVLAEVDSTNTYALRRLAAEQGPAADGTVAFAEYQSTGRGRMGRTWHSPVGASLMMTVLLWERARHRSSAYWMMASAVSLVEGIEASSDISPMIRWPNDIYVNDKKLAGILVETVSGQDEAEIVVIGIGVNCLQHAGHFPEDIREKATSLELASSHPVDRAIVARGIIEALDRRLGSPNPVDSDELTAAWSEHSGDIGQRVTLVCESQRYEGQILDVHPERGLMLQLDSGRRSCFDPATTSRLR